MSLLQGLYCLFVYEGNVGNGTKSVHYFHRAMEAYRSLNDNLYQLLHHREGMTEARFRNEERAMSWCMWGFYCCEW